MNLLDSLLNAAGGGVVKEIARNLGLDEDQASEGVRQLTPALSRGISRNIKQPGGLDALLGALGGGNHQRYIDQPELLGQKETVDDGNGILGHILGSKDVSRNVAGHASQQSGIGSGTLKKMLPMVAAAAMGTLGQQASGSGLLGQLTGGGQKDSGMAGLVEGFLDADRDGAVVDDLLSMAKKFF
jgi:hypothetical protein